MISIKDNAKCCGCSACVQRCPKQCISLKEDKEGFLYPIVDEENCIDCGLCEKVCPELNLSEERLPLKVCAAKHIDDKIRMKSSSGGVFSLLAEQVIEEGGVVFGARFDEYWEVIHDYTETKVGLAVFRGSKYVQSRIGSTYQQAEKFLKEGRKVMFTGTPCQIAGLKHYLRKEYSNLLAVDFVCHGVPSPKVWRAYLDETIAREVFEKNTVSLHAKNRLKFIQSIEFRSKSTGWKKFSFSLTLAKAIAEGEKNSVFLSSKFYDNPYMQAFLSNFTLRPSCYQCVCKSGRSGADITIGDFWGIEEIRPDLDDDKGIGLIMLYRNDLWVKFDDIEVNEMSFKSALKGNPCIECSIAFPANRIYFWHLFFRKKTIDEIMRKCTSTKFCNRLYRFVFRKMF